MTIHYTMEEEDYLTLNLYTASKSNIITRRRQRGKIAFSLLYAAVGSFFFTQQNAPTGVAFLGLAVAWYILYPLWERKYYIKSYKRMIAERNKDSFGKPCSIEFKKDHILSISEGIESKINYSEVEGIAEVPTTFLIQLKGGKAFILGKDKVEDENGLRAELIAITNRTKAPFISDLNWFWN